MQAPRRIFSFVFLSLIAFLPLHFANSQKPKAEEKPVQAKKNDFSKETPEQKAERMKWFNDARFGMFIHWGPVSLKGTEIGWSRGGPVPEKEYDALYKRFNPTKFDADAWAKIAKAAGMKYLVITAKHHDGFCLWPSKYTEYHIGNTPFKRDVLKELSKACKKHDVRFCVYYSICDWWHPDYPLGSPGGRSKKANPNMPRYVEYLNNQTQELIDGYGPLGLMWFDGEWEKPWTKTYGNALYKSLRKKQPSLIVNNRVSKGRHGMAGTTMQSKLNAGDYDTPEQRIGGFNRERPWETCMTICRQWAWKPNDRMKSKKECIQTLLLTAGGDGNLLFNVGPMPDGRIEPRQVERLSEIGDWLKIYGEGVYGTRGGPFKPGKWGASTCKNNRVFLYVMKWPAKGALELPAIGKKILRAKCLSGGKVSLLQSEKGIALVVPKENQDDIATVIELTVDGDAFTIKPVAVVTHSNSLAFGMKASASNVFQKQSQYAAAKAFDDNPKTRWATDAGTSEAWLEVELNKPEKVCRVSIDEREWNRVQKFQLQYKEGPEWKTIFDGTKIGADFSKQFAPITAQHFRLKILEATEGPTIWEFQLMGE